MQKRKIIFPILFCLLVTFTASIGSCNENIIPEVGVWTGDNISFNVSYDGTNITYSDLLDDQSIIVTLKNSTKKFSMKVPYTIPIQKNGWFHFKHEVRSYYLKIDGKFDSPNHASGNASFRNGDKYGACEWTAQPDSSIKYDYGSKVSPIQTFKRHTKPVWTIKMTPDLKRVVSGSLDKTINVWEMGSGNLLGTLKGHSKEINTLTISPDGKLLASAGEDRKIIIWDLETIQKLNTFKEGSEVASLVFIADGRQFATGTDNGVIQIRDIDTGKTVRRLEGHHGSVRYLLTTKDGKKLLSVGTDNTIKVWNLDDGSQINTLDGYRLKIFKIALSPDEKKVVSVFSDKTIMVWDLATGQSLLTLTGHKWAVTALAITPDGTKIISGSLDDTIRIWDMETGTQLKFFYTHSGGVCDIIVLPDGKQFVTGLGDGTLKLWDLESIMLAPEMTNK